MTWSAQAFMLKSFRNVEIGSWDRKYRAALNAWWEAPEMESLPELGEIYLPAFMAIFDKFCEATGYEPSPETSEHLRGLAEIRDQFAHFKPVGRSIEAQYLRQRCGAGLEVIAWALDHGLTTAAWASDEQEASTRRELAVARSLANPPD